MRLHFSPVLSGLVAVSIGRTLPRPLAGALESEMNVDAALLLALFALAVGAAKTRFGGIDAAFPAHVAGFLAHPLGHGLRILRGCRVRA